MTLSEKDFTDKESVVYNDDSKTGDLRCPGCSNASFTIHRQRIENEKTGNSIFTEVAMCISCFSSCIVKNLKENYDNYENKGGIVTIRFKDWQITSLDSILNLQKEAIESTITKNNNDDRKQQGRIKQLKSIKALMKLVKSTATEEEEGE
jgi:hypothetical protein